MKQLLITLFAVALIASCKDNPATIISNNNQISYPYTVGTWEIISPDSANWIGKKKAITSPQDQGIILTQTGFQGTYDGTGTLYRGEPGWFYIYVIDSSFTTHITDSLGAIRQEIKLADNFKMRSPMVDVNENVGISASLFSWDCDTTIASDNIISFQWIRQDNDSIYATYDFKADGFTKAIYDLSCQ